MSIVTEADISPHGWICEACSKPFAPGDEAFAGLVGGEYGHDPYGLLSLSMGGTESDSDLESGHISSRWRCRECFEGDVPIPS